MISVNRFLGDLMISPWEISLGNPLNTGYIGGIITYCRDPNEDPQLTSKI